MPKIISAIYENGFFKPLENVNLSNHQRVKLEIIPEDEQSLVRSQKKALLEIAGIGNSGSHDIAREHNKYLYRKDI